jgi:hypothetical protein
MADDLDRKYEKGKQAGLSNSQAASEAYGPPLRDKIIRQVKESRGIRVKEPTIYPNQGGPPKKEPWPRDNK